jgi:asparagine synthase (glutamine-hydrolysing)
MDGIVPEKIRKRVDKKGFSTPEKKWLQILKYDLLNYIEDDLEEYINLKYFKKKIENNLENVSYNESQFIWRIFSLSIWKKIFKV